MACKSTTDISHGGAEADRTSCPSVELAGFAHGATGSASESPNFLPDDSFDVFGDGEARGQSWTFNTLERDEPGTRMRDGKIDRGFAARRHLGSDARVCFSTAPCQSRARHAGEENSSRARKQRQRTIGSETARVHVRQELLDLVDRELHPFVRDRELLLPEARYVFAVFGPLGVEPFDVGTESDLVLEVQGEVRPEAGQ